MAVGRRDDLGAGAVQCVEKRDAGAPHFSFTSTIVSVSAAVFAQAAMRSAPRSFSERPILGRIEKQCASWFPGWRRMAEISAETS